MSSESEIMWQPSEQRCKEARITQFMGWLAAQQQRHFDNYEALWQWSVDDQEGFWQAVVAYYDIAFHTPYTKVLARETMPGAQWFVGGQLNFVEHILRHQARQDTAILYESEAAGVGEISWAELARQVAACAYTLRQLGVGKGDRVCAYLPNTHHAVIAFLATASIGAIWSIAAPDMGVSSIVDRFSQIEPKVLIACDGYKYGGKVLDRTAEVNALQQKLPSLKALVTVPLLGLGCDTELVPITWDTAVTGDRPLQITAVDFDHPLWILYSSGTTGLPKPIVHGHGGMLVTGLLTIDIHSDLNAGERYGLMSSTGWMVWNVQLMGLLVGATICLFEGSPTGAGSEPDLNHIWDFVARNRINVFGSGAAYYALCLKQGLTPGQQNDLSNLRMISATGSPLSPEAYRWIYSQVKQDIWLNCISGGTDICGAFLTGVPTLPVHLGEMQCRSLGAAVYAFDEAGQPIYNEVGELVCVKPLPSMPLYFWGDASNQRYLESYFDMYKTASGANIWRHGDWLKLVPHANGATGALIYGRSDTTINRQGIRIGSSEIYRAVEALPEVLDSLLVDLEYLGKESYMPLFVQLQPGVELTDTLQLAIKQSVRNHVSPRMVPNDVFQVQEIPYTLTGKKVELPIKKLLLGQPEAKVINRDAIKNPQSLTWFIAFAASRV